MALSKDKLWYKEAIIYEIPIRAFRDSNADGIGDLRGLIEKLDYVADLGVTAIWLLPFYPSPHLDGGYDIADYTAVHPMYGTLDDFRELLDQAHARGIRVITELVINHTSKSHPWFERARHSPADHPHRDFYVWSQDPKRYKEARIIFKDYETSNWTWDPVAKAYYWHRFYSHQPDLNFENPKVHEAVTAALDFWFELGVDGMRLDAIPYLYEREGTICENLPETHAFLQKLRAHVDAKYEDKMLLAEANQWPEDAAAYFGEGNECHMNFHFPLMPRMFMALEMEDRYPIVDILEQTPSIPENCQWATFLRNHDELTLEMVTDEDRDYMYRAYADDPRARLNLGIRRRLAPLLDNRSQIDLMLALLFSLPGTPVLYYGDEIGMGDNIYLGDRDGVRTPMQWSADRNAGFSSANPQRLYLPVSTDPSFRYEAVNVESQEHNTASLLWTTKRLIAQRKRNPALAYGTITFLSPDNARVLCFVRKSAEQQVLVVANLSRLHQTAELDLAEFSGFIPREITGGVRFRRIEQRPWVVMLPPHGFLWLSLEASEVSRARESRALRLPLRLPLGSSLAAAWPGPSAHILERALGSFLIERRWFASKDRVRTHTRVLDLLPLVPSGEHALVIIEQSFTEGEPDLYLLPLTVLSGALADEMAQAAPQTVVGQMVDTEGTQQLVDGLAAGVGLGPILARFSEGTPGPSGSGQTRGHLHARADEAIAKQLHNLSLPVKIETLEQTNTTVVLGNQFIFKLYRRIAFGPHPELEMGRFLANTTAPVPRLVGSLEYRSQAGEAALGVLHEFVTNEGNAWQMTVARLRGAFEQVLASSNASAEGVADHGSNFFGLAEKLGQRIAELHLALVGDEKTPEFCPEPFSSFHQKSIYQRARTMLQRSFDRLARAQSSATPHVASLIEQVLIARGFIDQRLNRVTKLRTEVQRIRTHGDLHLGQILFTGQDFLIVDFEGEPARPLHERRYKRCALRDVMGVLRSFDYAVSSELRGERYREEDYLKLNAWAQGFLEHTGKHLVAAYFARAEGAVFLPTEPGVKEALMEFFEFEKVIYEIRYELENRPDWLELPLTGLLQLLKRCGYA